MLTRLARHRELLSAMSGPSQNLIDNVMGPVRGLVANVLRLFSQRPVQTASVPFVDAVDCGYTASMDGACVPSLWNVVALLWITFLLLSYLLPVAWSILRGRWNIRQCYPVAGGYALVTGASTGLGYMLADSLAAQGFNVVLVAPDDEYLKIAFAKLRKSHPRVDFRFVGCDLTSHDAEYMAYIEAVTRDIHVAVVFLNACVRVPGPFHTSGLPDHLACINCNVAANTRIAHHFLPLMYASSHAGLVCFSSSPAAYIPSTSAAIFAATNAFASQLVASLATEAKPHGVDVMAVHHSLDDPPDRVLARIYRSVGTGQVLADLGLLAVVLRVVTFAVPANILALTLEPVARLAPIAMSKLMLQVRRIVGS